MATNSGDTPRLAVLRSLFIVQFHNLPGNSALDKQQSLYKVLRQRHTPKAENTAQVDLLVKDLHPKNHLETILYIDLLIYFKRFLELFVKFQSGDEIAVNKLIKQEWFLKQLFDHLDPKELIYNVFPTLPYPVRLKILNKLQLDQVKADEMFDLQHTDGT